MTIDISIHLRRLVMAGLPLLASGCPQGDLPVAPTGGPGEPASLVLAPSCEVRQVFGSPYQTGFTANIGFDRDDPRWSDLFTACTEESLHCQRLCNDILAAARPPMYGGTGSGNCELGCDAQGGAVATIRYSNAVPGRRPEGVCEGVPTAPGTSLAAFWAACAAFEGASVIAFDILAEDLRRLGAPDALVGRALVARADERRHFRITRKIAAVHGAAAVNVPPARRGEPRALGAIALQNATEGCVGETFAAALALWQAEAARSAPVRKAMKAIAADELAHAQLAWDVDAWIRERLDGDARRSLDQARAAAGDQLVAGSAAPVDPLLVREAGLPAAGAARRLAEGTRAALWSA